MEKRTMGKFISSLRKAKGYTQEDLAEILNVSNKTVSSWENDNSAPDISLLIAIADLFEISVDELLRGEKIVEQKEENKELSKQSEKIKNNLYKSMLNKYRNSKLISIFIFVIAALLIVFGIFLPVGLSGFWFLIFGIIIYISGIVYMVISHNNIKCKNDGENKEVNYEILNTYTKLKSLYSFFFLWGVFESKKNRMLLDDDEYEKDDSIVKKISKNQKSIKAMTIVFSSIIVVITALSFALQFSNPILFSKKYTKQQLIDNEYTFNIKYDDKNSAIEVNNTIVLISEGKWSAEEIATIKSIPAGEYHFDFYFGSYKDYQLGRVEDGDFSINYDENGLLLYYKDVSFLFVRKYRVNGSDAVYFSLSGNEYTYVNGKYGLNSTVMNINKNLIPYILGLDYVLILSSAGLYSLKVEKIN